jgi:hypothetical protein
LSSSDSYFSYCVFWALHSTRSWTECLSISEENELVGRLHCTALTHPFNLFWSLSGSIVCFWLALGHLNWFYWEFYPWYFVLGSSRLGCVCPVCLELSLTLWISTYMRSLHCAYLRLGDNPTSGYPFRIYNPYIIWDQSSFSALDWSQDL